MSGYNRTDVKLTTRVKIGVICFLVVILSGFALLVSSQLDSGSPVNYSLRFTPVQNGDYYNIEMTGTITNRRDVEYPYLDFKVSFNVGDVRKTHIFRVEKLPPNDKISVNLVIETTYTVKPGYSRIEKITTPVKSAEWIAKTISLIIFSTALFVLIVPNILISVIIYRKKQRKKLLIQKEAEEKYESEYVSRRRELYLVTSKTGEHTYNFNGALIEADKSEPVPDSALSVVKGVYKLKNYEGIQIDRFSVDVYKDIAHEMIHCFDNLETGQEVVVTHMPAKNLCGNTIAELITRSGRRQAFGFLRVFDTEDLFNRYGENFMFYGKIIKSDAAGNKYKNKPSSNNFRRNDIEPEKAGVLPSGKLELAVPLLTEENRLCSYDDFEDYCCYYGDDEEDNTEENNTEEDNTENT